MVRSNSWNSSNKGKDGQRLLARYCDFHKCRVCGKTKRWCLRDTGMKRVCPKCYERMK